MSAPYSLDLRDKAVTAYENGEGTQLDIANRFCVGLTAFREWLVLKREHGDIKPKEWIYRGRKPIIDDAGLSFIKRLVENKADILISEIRESYKKRFKVKVAQSMVSRALEKLNLNRKKKSHYAQEQAREDVKKKTRLGRKNSYPRC
jgi:transposase